MGYERSIKLAYETNSKTLLDADELFRVTKDAFSVRREFHEHKIILECCECEQSLAISTSKYDRLYFKHLPNAGPCLLKDGKLTALEADQLNHIFHGKESERHKYLKHKISGLLKLYPDVIQESITTDDKFISEGNEKRKPDIYCRYSDKQLVFEIQLSNLPLRYILDRYNFYRKKGIYLIWILDKFDVHGQSQMERDIKYLSKFQNFFKLDEVSESLKLVCTYKQPMIHPGNYVVSPWRSWSVSLEEINFCNQSFQVYYHDYDYHYQLKETELSEIKLRLEVEQKQKDEDTYNKRVLEKARGMIAKIAAQKTLGFFMLINEELDKYTYIEVLELNRQLDFNSKVYKGRPLLHHYISTATSSEHSFLHFLLDNKKIHLDVNRTGEDGISCFRQIFTNPLLYHGVLIKLIFQRGYKLKEGDLTFFESISKYEGVDLEAELLRFAFYDRLTNRFRIDDIYNHINLFYIFESAKLVKIVGFKFNNWVSFGINAIEYYKPFWDYIEIAFKKYGVWDLILNADKKGTFEKKISAFYQKIPSQNYDLDQTICEIFPDLFS